ncbi:hypothetical protein SAMN00768000_3563 [Sulfobacillus thermosulfidooxidans DSM 9293]|uniref:Uncharacterized protein n=1 Tax=Sulfobacillus thermosulfidooxidans (strain DSM 9293 / VKM B-1269 / AT-1) TaxID=929705 RepID=A0A1W1WNS3_SULTA|nr:hypothetical protein SAMN00768000_3563 [Sulfobacillus thermosulfidooxidans DSM 9293]
MRVIQQFDQQWQKNGAKIYHVAPSELFLDSTPLPHVMGESRGIYPEGLDGTCV